MNPELEKLLDLFLTLPSRERDAEFLTVKEVALLLGKDNSTIRRMVSEEKLRGFKVIGEIRIYKPSVRKRLKDSNPD